MEPYMCFFYAIWKGIVFAELHSFFLQFSAVLLTDKTVHTWLNMTYTFPELSESFWQFGAQFIHQAVHYYCNI